MFRKMYQGGSSREQAPMLVIREPDLEPPREAQVRPCEWPSDEFMVHAGFKDEFDAYAQNVGLEDFVTDKCHQYYQLTDSFVRRFKFTSKRNSHTILFDLYDESYTMDLEPRREATVRPCEWPSDELMIQAGFKDEFDAYVRNADLEDFV